MNESQLSCNLKLYMSGTDHGVYTRKYSLAKMSLLPYPEQHGQNLTLLTRALCLHKTFLWLFLSSGCESFTAQVLHKAMMDSDRAGKDL